MNGKHYQRFKKSRKFEAHATGYTNHSTVCRMDWKTELQWKAPEISRSIANQWGPVASHWRAHLLNIRKTPPRRPEEQERIMEANHYRYLNSQTKDDPFPLSLLEDLVYKQARNAILTIFDLEDGFHQMHLAPISQELTAFVTSQGLYHWTVLPMGVKNGPAMFQLTSANNAFSRTML